MSKNKVDHWHNNLLLSKRVTDYLFIKTSVNIYCLSNLNQILVILWQKNKKRKQDFEFCSLSSEIYTNTFFVSESTQSKVVPSIADNNKKHN